MAMENGGVKKEAEEVKVVKPAEDIKVEDVKKTDIKEESETEETKVPEIKKEDIKTEASVKSEEHDDELLEKIKSQVEFYFGDINLQRDKFLIGQIKLSDGWVPLSVMLKFQLLASITTDVDAIVKALKSSELIETSEDSEKIRRSPKFPLPTFDEAYRKAQTERTVYIKGFPLNGIYIQKLKDFFKDYEPFENIVLRKYADKSNTLHFKGSIFIQFKTLEGAKAFMARESIKYNDTELIRKFSDDYSIEKAKEKKEKKEKRGKKSGKSDEHKKNESGEAAEEGTDKVDLPKGAVLHFNGVSNQTYREAIKSEIEKIGGKVAFIDFKKGDKEGWVRLREEGSAKEIIDKMENNKLTIDKETVTFRLLEGEEEETYLKTVKENMSDTRKRSKSSKRGGHSKRGRGGDQRGQKRRGSPARGEAPAKKSGTD